MDRKSQSVTPQSVKPLIVIIEDDDVDVEAVSRGLNRRKLESDFRAFPDGKSGIEFLRHHSENAETPQPFIVILDINMPGMNGHQFLDALRNDERLSSTLVFVLTTSNHSRDREQAYDRNVAGYFVKSNLESFLDILAIYATAAELPV